MSFTNLDRAKAQLLRKSPFFATLLLGTPVEASKQVPTAATNGRKIIYNPDFFNDLSVNVIQFVLAHEIGHIIYEHVARKHTRNAELYNIAGDYVINQLLKDDGFELWPKALLDEQYKGMYTEQVYDLLLKEMEKSGKKPQSDGMGQDLLDPDGTPEDAARNAAHVKRMVAQAANVARMAGKLSAGLEQFVNEVLNPRVPWQELLRDYMTRTAKDDETWRVRNRRFSDVYLPARYSERMGEIVIIGDTSGSIGADELNQVAAEVNAIAEAVKPECIRVIWADAAVCGEQTFEVGEAITFQPKGGGGTDMRVPLEYVEQYSPEIVILATDGYTPWPDCEPPYPLIVVCSTNTDVPIGQVVRL